MTPATGLKSGQKALVQASGFSPGESLVVTECAAKGAATGPGDCDLNGMQSVTADASGQVKVDLTVTKGPFGANNIVCGPVRACLISVTQATPSPTQEADTPITFGLPGHASRDDDSRAMIVTSAPRQAHRHEDDSGCRNTEEHPCHQQFGCERECHGADAPTSGANGEAPGAVNSGDGRRAAV